MRCVRLLLGCFLALLIGGVLVGCATSPSPSPSQTPTASIRLALPATPTVYFFGDSWTTGYDADQGRGYPEVVGEALGWTVLHGPDSSGAGYVYTFNPYHPIFPVVTRTIDGIPADLIVLQGSVNDLSGPIGQLAANIRETVRTLQAKSGDASIVMVGPAPYQTDPPEKLSQIDRTEASVARQLNLHYISPLQERWFSPQIVQALIDSHQHPTTAGHAYFGGRLAADLRQITTTRESASG